MKKLNARELKAFIMAFEIKCREVIIYDDYILIDKIEYKNLKQYYN